MRQILGAILISQSLVLGEGRARSSNIGDLAEAFLQVSHFSDCVAYLDRLSVESNPDVADIKAYLQGGEYDAVLAHLWNEESGFRSLYDFLVSNGVNMFYYIHSFNEWAGRSEFTTKQPQGQFTPTPQIQLTGQHNPRSIGTVLQSCLNLMPSEDILAWATEQIATNPEMVKFLEKLQEPGVEAIVQFMKESPQFLSMRCGLLETGIAAAEFENTVCTFLGWSNCVYPSCSQ